MLIFIGQRQAGLSSNEGVQGAGDASVVSLGGDGSPRQPPWDTMMVVSVSYLALGPGGLCGFLSKCLFLPRMPHRTETVGLHSCSTNHAMEIYFLSLCPTSPWLYETYGSFFKQSLKSSDLQISSLSDQLYIFCI